MTDFTQDPTYLQSLPEEDLDEIVHDLKSNEAADINNAGREAQVAYLTEPPAQRENDLGYVIYRLVYMLTLEYGMSRPDEEWMNDMLDQFEVSARLAGQARIDHEKLMEDAYT